MVSFFNQFISYLLLVFIMAALAVCGVLTGKKLRDAKDAKEAAASGTDKSSDGE